MTTLTLYTRRDCHLCEEMKAVIREVGRTVPLTIEEVDIDRDRALVRRYGRDIPVLIAGGQEIARHRVTADRLREVLEAQTAGHHGE